MTSLHHCDDPALPSIKRKYSTAFKRQVVQEYLAGANLRSLARRHDLLLTEIRIWVDQYLYPSQGSHPCETGNCDHNAEAAAAVRDYEAAASERLSGPRDTPPPEDPD